MVMFGTALRTRRLLTTGVNHSDESHHSFILMTQDVAVKDELASDVLVEAHDQAHLSGRHRIIRRPIGIRQSHAAIAELVTQINNRVSRHLGASRRALFEELERAELS
jgi:hypothetical protein